MPHLHCSFQPSSAEQGDQHVRELCDLDFGAHRTAEALPPCRPFMRPNRPRDRCHSQRRHRQDELPGPITAQGCGRQAAGAKACRKACAPQDSKDLALKSPRLNIFAQHEMLMVTFRRPQPPAEDIPIYNGRGCTLLELSQGKCRWPISNPGAQDFCFCGNEPVKGLPYCAGHARIAYRSVGRQRSSAGA